MTPRTYIFLLIVVIVASVGAFLGVVFFVDPESYPTIGPGVFYATLFFLGASLFALLVYVSRTLLMRHTMPDAHIRVSLREGVLLAATVLILLMLQSLALLTWWGILLVLLFVVLLELFFLSKR